MAHPFFRRKMAKNGVSPRVGLRFTPSRSARAENFSNGNLLADPTNGGTDYIFRAFRRHFFRSYFLGLIIPRASPYAAKWDETNAATCSGTLSALVPSQ